VSGGGVRGSRDGGCRNGCGSCGGSRGGRSESGGCRRVPHDAVDAADLHTTSRSDLKIY
jgi:hypothetical protein